MNQALSRLVASATLTLGLAAPIVAQGPSTPAPAGGGFSRTVKSAAATVTSAPVTIDGRLQEPAWHSAPVLNGFVQREPLEGTPVTERTEVRILVDAQAIYVGAWLYDADTTGIVPGEKIRDGTLTNSDYFGFVLDTYLDRQNGFLFGTTPAAIEYDGQVTREGEGGGVFQSRAQAGALTGFNLNWDGSWTVATSRDSLGWYAEFRIPFSTIRYGKALKQEWGLNLMRGIRRRNEEALWVGVPRQFSIMRLSQAGLLREVPAPPRQVATATPYVLTAATRQFATEPGYRTPREWGVDAKYGVTPSLTLDLTYNTDFAQVEVDEQRTNLTRFSLFYPEKRPFFLENAGAFSAGSPQAVELFFSRRIGLDSLGRVTPIIGGGRLSGKAGGVTIGALHMATEGAGSVPGNEYSVLRAMRELSSRSRFGVIGVQRSRAGDAKDYNRVFGADGRLALGQDLTVDWWGARSESPQRAGDDYAYTVRGSFQSRNWNSIARVGQVGAAFNAEAGFLARAAGYRVTELAVQRSFRDKAWRLVREWNPHITFLGFNGFDGTFQTGQIHVDVTEAQLKSGGKFGPEVNFNHDRPAAPFALAPGVVLPPGPYDWAEIGMDLATDPSKPISLSAQGLGGEFYNGHRLGARAALIARRGSTFSTTFSVDYQDIRLPQGGFMRELIAMKGAYFFSPRISLQSLLQYSSQQRVFASNVRFTWLSTAGTGLFIVFNDGEQAESFGRWRAPILRSFTVKFTRQFGRT